MQEIEKQEADVTTEEEQVTEEATSEETTETKEQSLGDKLKELGIPRDQYFKMKGETDPEAKPDSKKDTSTADERLARVELRAEGVTDLSDIDAVMDAARGLGISPTEALQKPFVKALLESSQKAREVVDATPSATNRNGQSSPEQKADYWVKKGELPPKEQKTLRREVMHKLNASKQRSKMFNN
jgi:hypothetical protein